MASRFRIGTALLGAIAALTFSALPASAEVIVTEDGGSNQKGEKVLLKEGPRLPAHKERYLDTAAIRLQVMPEKKDKFFAYCVELPTDLKPGDHLRESTWGEHPNKEQFNANAGKILWILTNSYPSLNMDAFKAKWGGDVTREQAIAATQAAIWHFSDGAELDMGARDNDRNSDNVKSLYTKFLEQAKNEPSQPLPTLEIKPETASGQPGQKIGPFQVTTTATEVKLTANLPAGVTLTDADGKPLDAKKKDDKLPVEGNKIADFYVNVAAGTPDGEAKVQLSAQAQLKEGRLFVAKSGQAGSDNVAQSLVTAQPQKVKVEKEIKANWTAGTPPTTTTTTTTTETTTTTTTPETTTPTTSSTPANPAPGGGEDDLASTGASILWPLLGGLVLVGAGVGALFVVRRNKAGA
ncbi:thioester domain-containing protein [Lentzea californiensis]|uniref:thioester domain-containing protein n=1 Tax=Lentzea californiensis TaxID=438851 RepID=UPI0021642059|nr:thioester domain-containing protein [Lentzea californiensis]MCR3747282.1 LPXTG-motif cell wall anchor domain-containing protein/TQXA domain-containing protein [Lentzea californiensis]